MSTNYVSPLLHKAVPSLIRSLESLLDKNNEPLRIARVGTCLLLSGGDRNNHIILKSESRLFITQQEDGGWIDTEETIWSLAFLKQLGHGNEEYFHRGLIWLHNQRHGKGGWGRSKRDIPRIPVTGLLLRLLPQLSDQRAVNWLKNEWRNDLQGDTPVTYKGGFFLMGLAGSKVPVESCALIRETCSYITKEQNNDGGFGPWKDHPIGSDPWSTGIVLLGLLSYPELVKREVIEKVVNWLAEKQLPNGLWPYHYIDEGSAYAFWGLVEALKYLARGES